MVVICFTIMTYISRIRSESMITEVLVEDSVRSNINEQTADVHQPLEHLYSPVYCEDIADSCSLIVAICTGLYQ